jgi:glutathione S-transferase
MTTLHHVPGSRSQRVLWLLEELGEPVELRLWSLTDGGLRGPEFRALSPAGRVPALEIDGRVIFESGAIVQYLTETRGRLGAPAGTPERVPFLEWLSFAETQANIMQSLNIQHIFLRPQTARSVPLMRLDTKRLELTMRALDAHLTGRDWLLSAFSAAECMFGFNMDAMFRFVPRANFPALSAWVARAQARPAWLRAQDRGGASLYGRDFYELPDA